MPDRGVMVANLVLLKNVLSKLAFPSGSKERKVFAVDREVAQVFEHLSVDLNLERYVLYAIAARILFDLLRSGSISKDVDEAVKMMRELLEVKYGGLPSYLASSK